MTDLETLELTPSDQALLKHVASGLTDREIANRMFVSSRTVQYHLARLREKTGTSTRMQLALWASNTDAA